MTKKDRITLRDEENHLTILKRCLERKISLKNEISIHKWWERYLHFIKSYGECEKNEVTKKGESMKKRWKFSSSFKEFREKYKERSHKKDRSLLKRWRTYSLVLRGKEFREISKRKSATKENRSMPEGMKNAERKTEVCRVWFFSALFISSWNFSLYLWCVFFVFSVLYALCSIHILSAFLTSSIF